MTSFILGQMMSNLAIWTIVDVKLGYYRRTLQDTWSILGVVETGIDSIGHQCLQFAHPPVFLLFYDLRFCYFVSRWIFNPFNYCEPGMLFKNMPRKLKVLCWGCWISFFNLTAIVAEAEVEFRFSLSNILHWTEFALKQAYDVFLSAVWCVVFVCFFGDVAWEGICFGD